MRFKCVAVLVGVGFVLVDIGISYAALMTSVSDRLRIEGGGQYLDVPSAASMTHAHETRFVSSLGASGDYWSCGSMPVPPEANEPGTYSERCGGARYRFSTNVDAIELATSMITESNFFTNWYGRGVNISKLDLEWVFKVTGVDASLRLDVIGIGTPDHTGYASLVDLTTRSRAGMIDVGAANFLSHGRFDVALRDGHSYLLNYSMNKVSAYDGKDLDTFLRIDNARFISVAEPSLVGLFCVGLLGLGWARSSQASPICNFAR